MTYRSATFATALLAATAVAQSPPGVVTRALEPAAADLARLNLVPLWRLYLPVEDRGDAVASVQPFDDQVFVQLQSGRLIAIQADANTKTFRKGGEVLWSYRPERPPGVVRPLAVGPTEVYALHGQRIIIFDRADGKVKYTEDMQSTASAGPVVDGVAMYIALDNRRVVAYSHVSKIPGFRPPKPVEAPDPIHRTSLTPEPADALSTVQNRSPSIARLEVLRPPFRRGSDEIDSSVSIARLQRLRPPYREPEPSRSPSVGPLPHLREVYELSNKESPTRIQFLWELHAGGKVDTTPALSDDPLVPATERLHVATGRVLMTSLRDTTKTNSSHIDYLAEAEVSAPLTTIGDNLYMATADLNLISLSIQELREPATAANTLPRGKFTTGGPVFQKPVLTDDSVYVVAERWGLIRLRHKTLEPYWNERLPDGRIRAQPNPDVAQILSVSPNYIFALDRRGTLVVIDAIRGATLSSFDVSAFSHPVTNAVNDRVFLASSSGLLICLRERGKVVPEYLRKPPAVKKPPADAPPDMPAAKEQPKFNVPPKKAPEEKKAPDEKKGPEEKKAPDEKKGPEEKKAPDGKKE